jgi:hypothetical protein
MTTTATEQDAAEPVMPAIPTTTTRPIGDRPAAGETAGRQIDDDSAAAPRARGRAGGADDLVDDRAGRLPAPNALIYPSLPMDFYILKCTR